MPTSRPAWKDRFDKSMVVWALVAHSWLLIQIIEVVQKEDASDLSLTAFLIYTLSSTIWFFYAAVVLEKRSKVIMVSSGTAFTLGVTTLGLIAVHGGGKSSVPVGDDPIAKGQKKAVPTNVY